MRTSMDVISTHVMHSSTMDRWPRILAQHITQLHMAGQHILYNWLDECLLYRSWLKLLFKIIQHQPRSGSIPTHLNMTKMPPPSGPSMFPTGTFTLSNVTYAVPAVEEYEVLMGLVSTPSPRSMRKTENPDWPEDQFPFDL